MGIFRRSPPAQVAVAGTSSSSSQQQQQLSSSSSNSSNQPSSLNPQVQSTRSVAGPSLITRFPTGPTSTTTSSTSPVPPSSPWAGYIDDKQISSTPEERARKEREQRNNKNAKKVIGKSKASPSPLRSDQIASAAAPAPTSRAVSPSIPTSTSTLSNPNSNVRTNETRKIDKSNPSSQNRTSSADIARFSINGMMNLVEQRMQAAELQEKDSKKRGLKVVGNQFGIVGLPSGPSQGRPPYPGQFEQSNHAKRGIHAMREEQEQQEELLSPSTTKSTSSTTRRDMSRMPLDDTIQSRTSTSSNASEATVLRDEVKELLLIARKASNELASSSSSINMNSRGRPSLPSNKDSNTSNNNSANASLDTLRSHSSASVRTNDSARASILNVQSGKYSSDMSRSQSQSPSPLQAIQNKKKFALFGSSNSGSSSSSNNTSKTKAVNAATSRVPQPPIRNVSAVPASSSNQFQKPLVNAATTQRVSRPHYGALTVPHVSVPRHGRKRSMSVPDPVPFSLIQAAGRSMQQQQQQQQNNRQYLQNEMGVIRRPRPDVYDESYFSSLKAPYYASITTEGQHKQRQNQLARLGIVEEATESNRAIKARSSSRIAAISMGRSPAPLPVLFNRNQAGHPGAMRSGNAELTRPTSPHHLPHSASSSNSSSGRQSRTQRNHHHQQHRVQDSDGSISSGEGQYATYELAAHVKIDGTSSAPGGFMNDDDGVNDAIPGVDLARSRSQRRRGQLMMASDLRSVAATAQGREIVEEEEGDISLDGEAAASASRHTRGHQQQRLDKANIPMLMRSNSDASFIDPYIPQSGRNNASNRGISTGNSNSNNSTKRMDHVAAMPSPVPSVASVDSLNAIGPPPSTPLPTLPGSSSTSVSSNSKDNSTVSANSFGTPRKGGSAVKTPAPANILVPQPGSNITSSAMSTMRSGLSPAPSPAPSSPLPPPPAPTRAPPPPPPPPSSASASSSAAPNTSSSATFPDRSKDENGLPVMVGYAMQLRPHRTQQQGRSRLSPVDERFPTSSSVSPARSGHASSPISPNGPYGMKGIPQAVPRELDMTVLPSSGASTSTSTSTIAPVTTPKPKSASTPISAAIPSASALRRMRSVGRKQNRPDTVMTVASQYSVDGDFDESDENVSRSSTGSTSYAPGMTYSHSGNSTSTTMSISTSASGTASNKSSTAATTLSRTSSSSGWLDSTRPSLSMDGHTEEDEDEAIDDHHSQASHGSSEISNNIAGFGTHTFHNLPHSKRMHFGWQRSAKASRNLAGGRGGEDGNGRSYAAKSNVHGQGRVVDEDEMYEGILGSYGDDRGAEGNGLHHAYARHPGYARDDEGYIGSSPEMMDGPNQGDKYTSQRQKSQYSIPVRHTRSFDQLSAFR